MFVLISGIEPPKCLHINTLCLNQCVNIFLFMHKMTLHCYVSFNISYSFQRNMYRLRKILYNKFYCIKVSD